MVSWKCCDDVIKVLRRDCKTKLIKTATHFLSQTHTTYMNRKIEKKMKISWKNVCFYVPLWMQIHIVGTCFSSILQILVFAKCHHETARQSWLKQLPTSWHKHIQLAWAREWRKIKISWKNVCFMMFFYECKSTLILLALSYGVRKLSLTEDKVGKNSYLYPVTNTHPVVNTYNLHELENWWKVKIRKECHLHYIHSIAPSHKFWCSLCVVMKLEDCYWQNNCLPHTVNILRGTAPPTKN